MIGFSNEDRKKFQNLAKQLDAFATHIGINNPLIAWEPWFAWHPVRVHGKLTWLKTVYRKPVWSLSDTFNTHYAYGTILDVLRDAK